MTRVLVVLPFYGGSLPVGRYCMQGLRDAGCLAESFEAPEFFSAFEALKGLKVAQDRLDFLEHSFLQSIGQAILAKVEAFAPDLVLAMAQAPMPPSVLKRLRKDGVPTAMWFVEDYRLFTYWRAFAPLYDIFAVIQQEPFFSELSAIGAENVLYLPLAAQPDFHRPLELAPKEKAAFASDLSFMGAGYPNRRALFRELTRYDFKIWGTEWEGESALAPLVQRNGSRISPEDSVKIYNSAAINLNLHSSISPDAEIKPGDFVNPRTFELAACGAFQLVDRRALLPELFNLAAPNAGNPGQQAELAPFSSQQAELAAFSSKAELFSLIEYYLKRPEERAALAERARKRVLAEHTYKQRMESLLSFAAQRLPQNAGGKLPGFEQGWPKARKITGWPEDLPRELQDELLQLLEKLQVPPQADFDAVITALRGQSGELAPLEAALLFLDEWKKQYSR